ncbi:dolichyl-phosphate-mannose-protein mannosyltransferase [Sphingomonas sp. Leaf412]|uniref:glycosyltransferase family 39 protein n=1 Tax=Sphingomonas sp. Leaf412 TaxID=1736370 RepID=UPI000701DB6F|nr:glycosyltransferase family 39 protein [Sphingomonas sp. Leaf412]KQT33542.1 dolichyl-phosphate-mannose-protein mannosyltransferase [Sphingomonas sp. Leaf412]
MSRMMNRPNLVALLIAIAAEAIFLIRLSVPHLPVFDEIHYLPAARAMLALSGPANIEHPPLAKELIALGIAMFGDDPFGWRVMSTLAGSATIAGAFALAHVLTRDVRTGIVAAILTLLGFTVYVQARIAMLDTFMLAFLLWGIVVLGWSIRRPGRGAWIAGAMLLGLATACKWGAAPYVAVAAAAFVRLKREDASRWPSLRIVPALALLAGVSVATYFATFLPTFLYAQDATTWRSLLPLQWEMYVRQKQVLPPHTYQSQWWTWPLLLRPIWYLYEPADGAQRGILLIGNPVVMWGGLVAVAALYRDWVKTGAWRLLAPALLWTFAVAQFALIPKSLGFYYYYYPASVFLCVAIAVALHHRRARPWDEAVVLAAFAAALYFLPVLTAQALTDPGAFRRWTWFAGWI